MEAALVVVAFVRQWLMRALVLAARNGCPVGTGSVLASAMDFQARWPAAGTLDWRPRRLTRATANHRPQFRPLPVPRPRQRRRTRRAAADSCARCVARHG